MSKITQVVSSRTAVRTLEFNYSEPVSFTAAEITPSILQKRRSVMSAQLIIKEMTHTGTQIHTFHRKWKN